MVVVVPVLVACGWLFGEGGGGGGVFRRSKSAPQRHYQL